MIVEHTVFNIVPGREEAFEAAFARADDMIAAAGLAALGPRRIARGVEQPSTYLLLVEWASVEDHLDLRGSELFARTRELIGPFLAGPPAVEHFNPID
jgi:heme-degrading monooxygenase HmoA